MIRKSFGLVQALAALPFVSAGLLSPCSTATAHAQAIPRITSQAENSALVALPGAVHPWARTQFDRGPAPANLRGKMLLALKRFLPSLFVPAAELGTLRRKAFAVGGRGEPSPPVFSQWGLPVDKLRYSIHSWQRMSLQQRTHMRGK